MNFFRALTELEWQRVRTKGRRKYIWTEHVLPIGAPIGMMIAGRRYVVLEMSWRDLFTPSGVWMVVFSIGFPMLLAAGWGFVMWHRQVGKTGGSNKSQS